MIGNMKVTIEDLSHPDIRLLLEEHHQDMQKHSPPESIHALDLAALKAADVTFWCAWEGEQLGGCGALKDLGHGHGEIKSMRTAAAFLRRGVAAKILTVIIEHAQSSRFKRLSLETGSMAAFAPAVKLYQKFGFEPCPPFANYELDPYSRFMTKTPLY